MITPTVGRIVLFTPARIGDHRNDKSQPLAAIVSYVHGDRSVNLAVFEQNGRSSMAGHINVPLLQDDDEPRENGFYCEWMPYQKGQAALTEQLERRLTIA